MDALIRSVSELFANNARYVVPAYQRPYVWTEDDQWMPLWEDVERVADSRLGGDTQGHFLGAVVIRLENAPPGGVTEWSVIDGQQRLTTLQVLISAMAAAAQHDGLDREARRLRRLTLLPEDDADGDERFKFWPTNINRNAFRHVVLEADGNWTDDSENTVHEAWDFFRGRVEDYVHAEAADEEETAHRHRALIEAVTGLLRLVTISLEPNDPAQVIFETLNARGTPLLAMDLVKNALLDGVEQGGLSADAAHERFWRDGLGDHEYWGVDQRLGRATVPRSEAFLMHWLTMQLGEVIPTDRLFDLFRRRVLAEGSSVDILRDLNRDAAIWRRFSTIQPRDPAHRFFRAMRWLDISTMHPVALFLFRSDLDAARRVRALQAIESYIVRRQLRGLSAKTYSQLAARLIASARTDVSRADELIAMDLLSSPADTYRWPDDDELRRHLAKHALYGWIGQRRLVFILSALEISSRDGKTEALTELPAGMEIEHVMPRAWRRTWPLSDPTDQEAAEARDRRLDLLGNLTLATKSLNAAMSNWPWDQKREELNKSLLLLNRDLWGETTWDDDAIARRGVVLTDRILELWPGPQAFMPEGWKPRESESWPENATSSPEDIRIVTSAAGNYLRRLLDSLADHPSERRRYVDVEAALNWPRGRLASVLGGFAVKFRRTALGDRRPWHLHLDADGVWWIWMNPDQASATRAELGT